MKRIIFSLVLLVLSFGAVWAQENNKRVPAKVIDRSIVFLNYPKFN